MDKINKTNIVETMQTAYLEYAMSVIVGRALPDVKDGLKPVHRRILYAMNQMGMSYNKPFVKSARVAGEVIGKYHPHGESAVYDAIVRLVQTFSMQHPLIDGQGNFGSVDGDSPAAMRYTEIRLKAIAHELLQDLEKNTVDFIPNYDDSLKEPVVLPAKLPNLLINGSSGIAVGMATNIPPHNLYEITSALIYVIEAQESVNEEELLHIVQGPDFPTSGIILGKKGIIDAYRTGKGVITLRAKSHTEKISENRQSLIITELPYAVNKARLIMKIAELVKTKKIVGISDIRDESDRRGMRVVIELKRGEIAEIIEKNLLRQTALQTSFGIIMLAIVNGQPQTLSLLSILRCFIDHRVEIINRRARYDLKKAEERAHILEGFKKAIDNIEQIIELIKNSENPTIARKKLMEVFALSMIQAKSILEMRLQNLTALEKGKIIKELEELQQHISYYKELLNYPEKILALIAEELLDIQKKYSVERRTKIETDYTEIGAEDLLPEESMIVTVTNNGYIKRCPVSAYNTQNRGGVGKIGITTREGDCLQQIFIASTHSTLLMFSNTGRVYWKKLYEIPLGTRTSRGRAIVNVLPLQENERIVSFIPINDYSEDIFIVIITEKGIIKKSSLTAYKNQRVGGIRAIKIDKEDNLVTACLCETISTVFIATERGRALRFISSQIKVQGRDTRGLIGIRLKKTTEFTDKVVAMTITQADTNVLTITENGYGKKSSLLNYPLGNRGNQGILNLRITANNGSVIGIINVADDDEIMLITEQGKIIRITIKQIRKTGRITQGIKLINLQNEKLASYAKVLEIKEIDEE